MPIQITRMDISDLNSITDTLSTEFDNFWNENIFKSELENSNSKYIVAKHNNEIVGFAGIWIAIDEAHITNIVTRKCYRNQGIGTTLLKNLIKLCNELNLNSITLEVNESNTPAIKLYEKFGFKQVGLRKHYYNNKDNALILTKLIKK